MSWAQALAWRMRRHELDPIGRLALPELVRRLSGIQAQVASSAELAVRVGGAVGGIWDLDGDVIRLAWFAESGKPPARGALEREAKRLGSILDRPLRVAVAAV